MFNMLREVDGEERICKNLTKDTFPYIFEIEFGYGDIGFSGRWATDKDTGKTVFYEVNLLKSVYGRKVNDYHSKEEYKEMSENKDNYFARLKFNSKESVDAVLSVLEEVKRTWDD